MILEDVERPSIEKYYSSNLYISSEQSKIICELCEYIKLLEEDLDENGWRNK